MIAQNVSVIVPTYKSLDFLKRTIHSLENQNIGSSQFEVIVIDDGSKDQTESWLVNYIGSLNLIPVIFKNNKGRSCARNAGVERASNPILIFLDGDMELYHDYVEKHARWHTKLNLIAVGKVFYSSTVGRRGYARYLQTRGSMKFQTGDTIPGRYFLSGNSSMLKDTFESVGGFDDSITHYGEDLDLGIRLEKAGRRMIYDSELAVCHLHLRPLSAVLETAFEYGYQSLPYLIKLHPELESQLRINWMESNRNNRIIKQIALNSIIYYPTLSFTKLLNEIAAPSLLYSYLIYRNYYNGYQKHIEKNLKQLAEIA